MTVSRRALLISNPGEVGEENYCKGVFADVANYQRLLKSPHGGFWQQGEISVLNRPSISQVRQAVRDLSSHTYSFIVFSGHGWYSSKDMCNVLTLRKSEEIASTELLNGASKRTAILDCCRKVHNESISESRSMAKAMVMEVSGIVRRADPVKCRDMFFSLISKASLGIIQINSCSIAETAGDDETLGGTYSSSLIAVAEQWAEQESKKPYWSPANVNSIVGAHSPANSMTQRRSGGTQNPQITKPRSGDYFPFTVYDA